MGSAGGVRGLLLMVRGEVRLDSLPLASQQKASLLEEVERLASSFNEARHGLPPRAFCYRFPTSSLLVLYSRWSSLFILLDADADLGDVEAAGRRLVATAHLGDTPRVEQTLSPKIEPMAQESWEAENPPPQPAKSAASVAMASRFRKPRVEEPQYEEEEIDSSDGSSDFGNPILSEPMSWNEATSALETILTKVLTHAQAARMIERAVKGRGILLEGSFDIRLFRQVGMELMGKIPSKPLRQSLTDEFEALLARMK